MSLFLTTTDPSVIAVVEANAAGRADLRARAHEWATERGSEVVMMNSFGGRTFVTGLPDKPEGFGQWTKPSRGSSHPYRTNEVESKALAALRHDAAPVPGLPETAHSVSNDGTSYLMWPTPFLALGAAWVTYPHRLEEQDRERIKTPWEECLASAFYAAHEALEAASKPASVVPA